MFTCVANKQGGQHLEEGLRDFILPYGFGFDLF